MKIFTSYNFDFSNCLYLYKYQAKNYSQILNKVNNNNTTKNQALKKTCERSQKLCEEEKDKK